MIARRRRLATSAALATLAAVARTPAPRAAADPNRSAFTPGQPWTDTEGAPIQAHGGQVVAATSDQGRRIWYWYGEDRSNGYANSPGVHVYSSPDLYNWTDRGLALRTLESADQIDTDPYFQALYGGYSAEQRAAVRRDLATYQDGSGKTPAVLERPKVIYNRRAGTWVMWVHADGPTETSDAQYAKARAGVAVSDSPFGPFRWIDSYRLDVAPPGEPDYQPDNPGMARDMNLFVDDDDTAYIVYSSEENYSLFVSKLDADYTYLSASPDAAVKGVDFTRAYIGAHREAPAMFRFAGSYCLITSGATGWDPNPASYATATDILGTWTDHGNPAVGDKADTTFDSQSTSVIPVDPQNGRFIFMADRWTPADLGNSPYIWLPIGLGEGTSMSLTWYNSWTVADDLVTQEHWTVDTALPRIVHLGDRKALPPAVRITSGGHSRSTPVRWDVTALRRPGPVTVTGRIGDGRTFSRPLLVLPRNTRYLINCGGARTADWAALSEQARTDGDLLNSVPDQALGTDPVTGTSWGYTGRSQSHGGDGGDLYTTLRYATDHDPIGYGFAGLRPGQYTVYAGYFDPWPQAHRTADIAINGQVVETGRGFTATGVAVGYPATPDDDAKITFTVTPTRSPDIQLSWIMIAAG